MRLPRRPVFHYPGYSEASLVVKCCPVLFKRAKRGAYVCVCVCVCACVREAVCVCDMMYVFERWSLSCVCMPTLCIYIYVCVQNRFMYRID